MRALHILLGLFRLLVITRGRVWGPWWAWRRQTAFGDDSPPPAMRRAAMRHFFAWIWRMP
ncbi:MAG: hypothetical protein QF733_04415 [Phycisphaerales bacterium]|jgi:hypothetical protein|nr:hypothetical protein [Phycisphaerales bacterium]